LKSLLFLICITFVCATTITVIIHYFTRRFHLTCTALISPIKQCVIGNACKMHTISYLPAERINLPVDKALPTSNSEPILVCVARTKPMRTLNSTMKMLGTWLLMLTSRRRKPMPDAIPNIDDVVIDREMFHRSAQWR
jgi:hypothetical protein